MKYCIFFVFILAFVSCIPVRIAPNIETDKVMVAKKFKRKLPKQNAFIFEDPKDANEFYNYINTKYELNHKDVEFNIPFEVEEEIFYFSFHEVEISDKSVNLVPIAVDAVLENKGKDPLFEGGHISRKGNWYIVVVVDDKNMNDCLKPDYLKREAILSYLKSMRVEYLETNNYLEALFKKT